MDNPSDKPLVEPKVQPEAQETDVITNLDEAVEEFKGEKFHDFPEVLREVDPSLHPALFTRMLACKDPRTVGAIENIRAFQGITVDEALEELMQTKEAHWILRVLDRYPEIDVMKLVDSIIEHDEVRSIAYDIQNIDPKLHDAVATKMLAGGGTVLEIFDGQLDHKFQNLGMDKLQALYAYWVTQDGRTDRDKDVFVSILWENMESFAVPHSEIITFLRKHGLEQYIKNGISRFNMPFGRENGLWLLEVGGDRVQERLLHNAELFSDSVSREEIFNVWWPNTSRRRMLANNLLYFEEFLDDEKLRELVSQGYKDSVAELFLADPEGDKETAIQRCFEFGLSAALFKMKLRFRDVLSDEDLLGYLIADGEVQALMNGLVLRSADSTVERARGESRKIVIDPKIAASQLYDAGMFTILAARLRMFGDAVDHDDLAKRLLAEYDVKMEEYKERVTAAGIEDSLSREAKPDFHGSPLVKFYPQFQRLSSDTLLEIMSRGAANKVLTHRKNQPRILEDELIIPHEISKRVVDMLLETGQIDALATHIDQFDDTFDRNELAHKILDIKPITFVLGSRLEKWRGLRDDVARRLVGIGYPFELMRHADESFEQLSSGTIELVTDEAARDGHILAAVEFNEKHDSPNKILTRLYKAFGNQFSGDVYAGAVEILSGFLSDDAASLGVVEVGEQGLNQYVIGLRRLRHQFVAGRFDDEDFDSDLKLKWFASVVRYEDSEWGRHDMDSLRRLKDDFFKLYKAGELVEMPAGYESAIVQVGKIDREAVEAFEHSEGFLSRYQQLLGSIVEAWRLYGADSWREENKESEQSSGLNIMLENLKTKREDLLSKLHHKKVEIVESVRERGGDPVRAATGLNKRIEKLEGLDLDSISHPQKLFNVLRSYKGVFDEELRQIMFYFAFAKHEGQRDIDWGVFDQENPTMEDLSAVINFVDHITNQETLGEYFSDKTAAKNFKGLMHVGALEEEFKRWQEQASGLSGTRPLQITPQRNLLTEMSGHVGDACWANSIPSILKAHPNFVSFTYTVNPGDPQFEKFVGAGFLIETKSKKGELVLVVRGNNPIEGFVNGVDALDLLYQTVTHFESIAEAREMKLAIVMDYSGGAGTNRPALQGAYDVLKSHLKKVELASNLDTQFNGYDIRNITFLVTSVEIKKLIDERDVG